MARKSTPEVVAHAQEHVDVDAVLRELKQAKDKELRLRAEKERVRKELAALRSGDLWAREATAQRELKALQSRRRELQTRESAESERLRAMDTTLREKELSVQMSRQSTLAVAASAIVVPPTPTHSLPLEPSNYTPDRNEDGKNVPVDVSAPSLALPTSKPRESRPTRISNQQPGEFDKVASSINLADQQRRIKELEDSLEKSKAIHSTASCAWNQVSSFDNARSSCGTAELKRAVERSLSHTDTRNVESADSPLHLRGFAIENEQASPAQKNFLASDPSACHSQSPVPLVSNSFMDSRLPYSPHYTQFATVPPYPPISSIVLPTQVIPIHSIITQPLTIPTFSYPTHPSWTLANPSFLSPFSSSPSMCNSTVGGHPIHAPFQDHICQTVSTGTELAQLQRQIDRLKRQEQQVDDDKEFSKVQEMISSLQRQITALCPSHSSEVITSENRSTTGARGLMNDTLESMKRQHAEAILEVRNQRDLLEEQDKLEEMQDRIEQRREERKRDLHREKWIAGQKRELLSLRFKRGLEKAGERGAGEGAVVPEMEDSTRPYDPKTGVLVCWDFVTGLPVSVETAQLAFAVYDGKTPRSTIISISSRECEPDGLNYKRGVFAIHRLVQPLPASTGTVLVVELSSVKKTNSEANIIDQRLGWAAIELFSYTDQGGASRLTSGWYKTNLVTTVMPNPTKEVLRTTANGDSAVRLHFRIAHGSSVPREGDLPTNLDVHAARYYQLNNGANSSSLELVHQNQSSAAPDSSAAAESLKTSPAPQPPYILSESQASHSDASEIPLHTRISHSRRDILDLERLRLLSSSSTRPPTESIRPRSTLSAAQRSRVGGASVVLPAVEELTIRDSLSPTPWIHTNNHEHRQRRLRDMLQPGDGFDVYVDGARFLPDNVTLTKVTIAALHADRSKISPLDLVSNTQVSLTHGDKSNPTYNLHAEYREKAFNHTLTLVIRVDTLDPRSLQPVILGYSLIPAFIDVETQQQPSHPNCQCALNDGAFQLPIYANAVLSDIPSGWNATTAIANIPRLPCATVLVRIRRAATSEDGLQVLSRRDFPPNEWLMRGLDDPDPSYQSGTYDSSTSTPSQVELSIYQARKGESMTSVQSALAGLGIDESIARALLEAKPSQFIDLRGAFRYRSELGLRVSVDGMHNVKLKAGSFSRVLFSIYPPGSFYRTIRLTSAVHFTRTTDWTSLPTSPAFTDGFTLFRGFASDPRMVVIVDIRAVTKNSKSGLYSSQPLAWSFAQVLDEKTGSVLSGSFQVPLFVGGVNLAILEASQSLERVVEDISAERKKSVLPFMDGASLFLRLEDPQLSSVLATQPFVGAIMSKMIPAKSQARYQYNAAKVALAKKKTSLSRQLAPGLTEQQQDAEINAAFATEMGIQF